jgi:uncharacterized 2Fe-2S/4Fe-4S cluster protein (DUF4445 family)
MPEYVLVPGDRAADGRPITFSQKDVRAVQLAKGALRSGIDLLCREAEALHPAKIWVAGAFGSYINKRDALTIGMFPPVSEADIEVVGNAAGAAAIMALFNPEIFAAAEALRRTSRVLDLSTQPAFQDTFMNSLAFPAL